MKKDKLKIVLIIAVIVVLIFNFGIILYNSNHFVGDYDKYIIKVYKSNKTSVEDGINDLLKTVEYKNLQKDEQVVAVGDLLRVYLEREIITGFNYSETNQLYTYDKKDGTTSGIMLRFNGQDEEDEETQEE